MDFITIQYDNKRKTVKYEDYLFAMEKILSDFGLKATIEQIDEQTQKLIDGEKLNVIGIFLEGYVVRE